MSKEITTTGGQLADVQNFKSQLNSLYKNAIVNYLGDEKKALRFLSTVSTAVQKTPKLMECTRNSLINAFLSCAELGFYPSNVTGEAYVIPYKGVASFQIGYQGYISLFYRAGGVSINAVVVYKNDEFEHEEGLNAKLTHRPVALGKAKGEAIGVYAVATLQGNVKLFTVMSKEDVMKHRDKSQSKDSEYSPWNEKNDPQMTMWKKTVIKQLAKMLPKNETILKAFQAEASEYKITDIPTVTSPNRKEDTTETFTDTETPVADPLDKDWEPDPEEKERILAEERGDVQGKLDIAKKK